MSGDRLETITILGCGGFIGSHLLERILTATHYRVEGIDLSSRKIAPFINHDRFCFHSIDIHDSNAIKPIVKKSGTVISLAALCNPQLYTTVPIDVIESNFVKMYPLVGACCEFDCRLIHFSTSEVYGRTLHGSLKGEKVPNSRNHYVLDEERSPLILGPIHAQRWSYACAKQLLERAIYAYGFERDLDYTIIRPFNFIGPRMDFIPGIDGDGVPRVFACFMDALLHEKPLQLVDGGKNRRCFTAIDDAIDAIMLIIARREAASRQIFNIGNPYNEITIVELATRMIGLYKEIQCRENSTYVIESISSREFYGEGYEDSDRRVPDCTRMTELLGWKPKIDLDEALRMAMKGFIKEYGNDAKGNEQHR